MGTGCRGRMVEEGWLEQTLAAPPHLSHDLVQQTLKNWQGPQSAPCGDDWVRLQPCETASSVRWRTPFESFQINGFSTESASMVAPKARQDFESEQRTAAPGLDRGLALGPAVPLLPSHPHLATGALCQEASEAGATAPASPVDALVEEVDSITIDRSTGFKFIRHTSRHSKGGPMESWARALDAHHVPLDFSQVVPKLAFEYPFELDAFQKQAVYHLERNESVFVAAHTSAGKTVVAEYAIALAQKHLTKAIYTSPIKALSNQKFRDFKNTFDDVGLLTGDIQLNPEASCLIMTTEILRSMLYRGADLLRDVEFVVFDEVHYVNDAERGVVWEEVIIMLPPHVTLIMLSATIPNTLEFADWVGRTKQREIFVISTLKRPVPLEHFLYLRKGQPLVKIVDAGRNFLEPGYKEAVALAKKESPGAPAHGAVAGRNTQGGLYRGHRQEKTLWNDVVHMLRKRSLLPVVLFTFSKRRCEENAEGLASLDLTSAGEKSTIHVFLEASLHRLKGTDSQLPQILRMREMLARGIAVHHSGILPIMKEAVEILFGRGLIKVLFATETFAMGVNFPTRTVVFSSIRKHDGAGFRSLLPGEYTQMAGRAGRRGLDPTGVVIIVAQPDELPSEITLRTMLLGLPTKLSSQFRLTYNMILNLLRVQALRIEEMLQKSFSENATQRALPDDQREMARQEADLLRLESLDCLICEPDLAEFYTTCSSIVTYGAVYFDWLLNESRQASRYLDVGRLVIVNTAFYRNVPGLVIRFAQSTVGKTKADRTLQVMVLRPAEPAEGKDKADMPFPLEHVSLPPLASSVHYDLISVAAPDLLTITRHRVSVDFVPDGTLHPRDLDRLQAHFLELLAALESPKDYGEVELPNSKNLEVDEKKLLRTSLRRTLASYQCTRCPDINLHYQLHHQHQTLGERLAKLRFKTSQANMMLLPEYQARVSLLKTLGYVDADANVQLKGRVAGEINTTDELITTELLFSNFFADFEPAEIVALLSCMVFQDKHAAPPKLAGRLLLGQERLVEVAKDLVTLQREHGVDVAMDQVLGGLKFGLVEVVHEWAQGRPFKEITQLTDVLEGSIVRCIVRLDETCRELRSAAKIMGDPSLHRKMEEASNMIKRDICFASSLYY